jgi:hypothetical protein
MMPSENWCWTLMKRKACESIALERLAAGMAQ